MTRWRVELAFAIGFVVLTVLTAVVPDWIELVFKVDPDAGSGSLEWSLVVAFAVLAVLSAILGRRDYVKANEPSQVH
jgi:hypothetical protein